MKNKNKKKRNLNSLPNTFITANVSRYNNDEKKKFKKQISIRSKFNKQNPISESM